MVFLTTQRVHRASRARPHQQQCHGRATALPNQASRGIRGCLSTHAARGRQISGIRYQEWLAGSRFQRMRQLGQTTSPQMSTNMSLPFRLIRCTGARSGLACDFSHTRHSLMVTTLLIIKTDSIVRRRVHFPAQEFGEAAAWRASDSPTGRGRDSRRQQAARLK